jgi:hypothetical protein
MIKDIWKSIKFESWEEQLLPSGKILLHCLFRDNYRREYKWTPRWIDVEEIFFKSLEIEGKNESEGVWDNELRRLSEKIPYRQHDIEVFAEANKILNEEDLMSFLFFIEANCIYYEHHARILYDFLRFFELESNKYISKRIYDSNLRMLNALNDLFTFMSDFNVFFLIPQDTIKRNPRFKLYPSWEIIEKQKLDPEEYDKKVTIYVDKLHKLVGAVRTSYKDYRANIREILFK